MLCIYRHSRRSYRIRRGAATWAAFAALICQIFLPFGHNPVAALIGIDCPGLVEAASHRHADADTLADRSGREQPARPADHDHQHSCPVCLDLQYAPPLSVVDAPALPTVALHWVSFVVDWVAPAPSAAEAFSRPLPRAPPVPA
jgi:hypothetical protein